MPCSNPTQYHRNIWKIATVLMLVASPGVHRAQAETYTVTSINDLQSRLDGAIPGDTIIVQDGSYVTSSNIAVRSAGTAANPITVRAESILGVTISGTGGFTFSSPAAYVEVRGFRFVHANAINIPSSTHHIRIMRNFIDLDIPAGTDRSYLNISGNDVEIGFNEMANKDTLGEMLDIAGSGSQVARRLWVHHNYFHDFVSPGGNGAETIRWGLSGLSLSTGDGLCEYNLFVRCNGENEMISNKSSGNIYRYNTVIDSAEISQRHGDFCEYYGNTMRNSEGIRIYGDSHLVHSNYLEGNTKGINIGNGDGDVHAGDALTSHDRPDNCVIVFNTLVENDVQFEMNGRTNGLGATNTTFANNIILGGNTAVSISSSAPYTNPTWSGNIIWNAASIGTIPTEGYDNVDPQLLADGQGILHLAAGSPAQDAAAGNHAGVILDMDGQPRSDPKDKGADEASGAAMQARLLTTADVGPNVGANGPEILSAPAAQAVTAGDGVTLAVEATAGLGVPLAFQWYRDGVPIEGATTATFALPSAQTFQAGSYSVAISSSEGSVTTNAVAIDVAESPASGSVLVNLSTRGVARTGAEVIIPGFVVAGTENKRVLLRAVGPGLTKLGVNDVLPDPRLVLKRYDGIGFVDFATNDDWGANANASEIATTAITVGAFTLDPGSTDAALLVDLPPGRYTAIGDDAGGASGNVLAELYDADAAGGDSRLVNISTRGFVGVGGQIMIPGFVIPGSEPKTLLIRAVGPGLEPLIGDGWLADPALVVYHYLPAEDRSELILGNDDWGTGANAARSEQAALQTGAFALAAGSKDAAFVVTLQPGIYTVHASGADGGEGIALVEVYELP